MKLPLSITSTEFHPDSQVGLVALSRVRAIVGWHERRFSVHVPPREVIEGVALDAYLQGLIDGGQVMHMHPELGAYVADCRNQAKTESSERGGS